MEHKLTLFVVLVVFTQSSLAAKETLLVTNLTVIKSAETDTIVQFTAILDGFIEIIHLLADASCQSQDCDGTDVNARIEEIKQVQIKSSYKSYDDTRIGLRPIARNVAVLDANLEEAYGAFRGEVELIHSVIKELSGNSYSETLAAIEAVERVAIQNLGVLWTTGIYQLAKNAVDTDNVELRNVLEHVQRTGVAKAKTGFDTIFAEFKILLIQLFDKTQCQSPACSYAIQSHRNLAVLKLTSEVHNKFCLFQYIATVNLIGDYQLIADYNKILAAEEAVLTATEQLFDSVLTVLIPLAEDKGISCNVIDAISDKLSSACGTMYVSTLAAASYMQPQGSAVVEVDAASGYGYVDGVVGAFIDAIKCIKKTNRSEASAEIDVNEKAAAFATINIYKQAYDEMENIAGCIDDDVAAEISSAWKTTASVFLRNTIRNIFAVIKTIAADDSVGTTGTGCGVGLTAINTAHNVMLYNVRGQVITTFDLIRASRLFRSLKSNGIEVPFSTLFTPV